MEVKFSAVIQQVLVIYKFQSLDALGEVYMVSLFVYLSIDKYLYRIETLQQYIHYKNINTAVITVCPA